MSKNSSQRTTADIVNSIVSELANLSPSKQATIFLLLWTAGIAYLGLTGCSPTKTPSNVSLTAVTDSSKEASAPTSSDTQTVYTYLAQQDIKPVDPAMVPKASGTLKLNPDRTVTVSGIIDSHTFVAANELVELAEESNKPIDIVISSPGGSVSHGLMFIQVMKEVKAKGIKIRCVVPTLAASMAFTILTQCDERYALPYAQLLFHSPRVAGRFMITAQASRQLAAGLTQLEQILLGLIIPTMVDDQDSDARMWFAMNYAEETLFTGHDLAAEAPKFKLKVIAKVEGYKGRWPAPYPSQGGASDERKGETAQPDTEEAK